MKHNEKEIFENNVNKEHQAEKQCDEQTNGKKVENEETVGNEETEQEGGETKELTKEELLEKQVKESEQKAADATDKYVRLAAEFDNYRRRTAKERLELISTAGEEVIKGLLPVLDDCERALQVLGSASDAEAVKAAKEGTELIYNKLSGYLKTKGLAVIEAKDKELDTEFHEAVAQFPVEDKSKKNKVIDIVQQGYTLNGKVIRYAKVVVGM